MLTTLVVMKALVLAGGAGTRLRPLSHSMAKQLVPLANKPILEHVLDAIRNLQVAEIGIIVGDRADQVVQAIGDGSRFGARITYIPQERPLGLAHCVMVAREFLGDDDFVMWLGDNVLPDGVAEIAEEFHAQGSAAQVVVQKVADPRAFGVVELDLNGRVVSLAEKPRRPRSDLAIVGVYFFTPVVHEAVARISPGSRGELEITDAIQWLVDRGADVRAREYDGYWKDVGRPADVLDCNRRVLGDLRRDVAGAVDEASVLRGAVVVAPGARVERSQIEGPVIIGTDSLVRGSRIGPDVSIGRGCVLTDTRVTNSIVMDRAAVTTVSGLAGSLVGRGTTVASGGRRRSRHLLLTGDDVRIEIAE